MKATDIFKIRPINEENNDFIITIGNHLATEIHFKTEEEAKQYIKYPRWETVFALIAEMIDVSKTREFKETIKDKKVESDENN